MVRTDETEIIGGADENCITRKFFL